MVRLGTAIVALLGSALVLETGSTDPAKCSSPMSIVTVASFVPPATPTLTRSSMPTASFFSTALLAKKKASAKKLQVKLLKHVAGTGQAGDVIQVTPAFFQNKLRPTKSATPISDEEVEKEEYQQKTEQEERVCAATTLKERLSDFTLHVTRKAGPDGQLFGGVSPKVILEELKGQVSDDYWNQKQVKIAGVTQDGKKMRGDIKHVGEFGATVSLTPDVSAQVSILVDAED